MSRLQRRLNPDRRKPRKQLRLKPDGKVPELALLANAEAEGSGDAYEVYAFLKESGGRGTIRIARAQALFDPAAVARTLAAKNALLPRAIKAATKLVADASSRGPVGHHFEVKRDGWRPDMRAFVHGGQVIGRRRYGKAVLKAPSPTDGRTYPLFRKGKLSGWHLIARQARLSSRMRLAICAAFAAPLLRVVDLQSFILVIFGPAKAGKSTVQLAAASTIGIGREGALPNFNATPASLQEIATEFNDSVLPVNEIGLLKGTKRDAYPSLRPLIYRYSEGRDTGRHSKSTYASDAGLASWRGIMVASSENSFEALADLGAEKRDEGEYARAFDVPAVRPGNKTVYDCFPRHIAPEQREAWARERLTRIRQLCAANHGAAFHPYAESLVEHRKTLKADVERAMERFLTSLPPVALSGALQHAARNFAVLYAGAVMAKRARLLPWNLATTRAALRACFLDGLREIERGEGPEERARKIILGRLDSLPSVASVSDGHDVEGWHEDTKKGRIFAVRTPCFGDWFPQPDEERAALRWLQGHQLLKPKDGARPDWPNVGWAVTWPRVQGKAHRCYQFRDPRRAER